MDKGKKNHYKSQISGLIINKYKSHDNHREIKTAEIQDRKNL